MCKVAARHARLIPSKLYHDYGDDLSCLLAKGLPKDVNAKNWESRIFFLSMSTDSNHSAAGQMAGYLFQPERALRHLALSPAGATVGVETLDDVAVLFPDGTQLREQDKHYTSKAAPLGDKSKALWNSLNIWLEAIDADELDLDTTELLLVTNRELKEGLAFDLKNVGSDETARLTFVKNLRKAGKHPTTTAKALVEKVLSHDDKTLSSLVSRIRVQDSTDKSYGASLRAEVEERLHLSPKYSQEIIQGLLGWVHETILELIRERKPAWIRRDAFSECYRRLMFRYQDTLFINETAEALVPVDEKERERRRNRLFIKQLSWVGVTGDDDLIIDAIDAHIRAGTEARRLAQAGVVTKADFDAMDARLIKRWKNLRGKHAPNPLPTDEPELEKAGHKLLTETMDHRETLAGQPTSEYYLTQGAYHRLADSPCKLGWHPKYPDKVKELNEPQEGKNASSE